MSDGVKLVASEVLGISCETIMVGGTVHVIFPPTIEKLCGAGYYLSDLKGDTLNEMLTNLKGLESACKALSWFIQGNEELTGILMKGTLQEVVNGIKVALSLVGIENFPMLSGLARSVQGLIATTR